jgi:hypothetical protein
MTITNAKCSRDESDGSFARSIVRAPRIPDGVLTPVTLGIHSTTEQFTVSAFLYAIGGDIYYHAASTGHTLSAVHATGIAGWLGALVMIDREGTITTKGNPDTGDQDHATEAAALASLIPQALAGLSPLHKIPIGTITLLTTSADWDGNTDAFDEADLAAANLLGYKGDRRWFTFNPGHDYQVESVRSMCKSLAGIAHIQVANPMGDYTGLLTHPRIEVDDRAVAKTTCTKLRWGDFDYVIDGVTYHKAAGYAQAFSAAHLVSLDCWGSILLRINAAGTLSTLVTGATQTTAMAYANQAAARAALPAAGDGYVAVAAIIIEADGSTWTANTDDLVAASDLENLDVLPVEPSFLLTAPTMGYDVGEPEDFHLTGFDYVIDGQKYTKAAATGIDFTSAKVVSIAKWMSFLVEIDTAGTVYTRCPVVSGRSQTAETGYDTEALAFAALPACTPGRLAIGHILLLADTGTWTANTDSMTDDLTSCTFVPYTVPSRIPFSVAYGLFASEVRTAATLSTDLTKSRRGEGEMLVLLKGSTGVVTRPELDVTYRPFPLNNEG